MAAKCFIDTNVFLYLFDQSAPAKRDKAMALVGDLLKSGRGVVSYQVVQEFCNIALKKMATPMSTDECQRVVNDLFAPMLKVQSSLELIKSGLSVKNHTGYQWYDSLLLAAALQANCTVFYSEDMQDQMLVRGMRIQNPFN